MKKFETWLMSPCLKVIMMQNKKILYSRENIPLCKRAVLYITKRCNIKCKFCYYRFEPSKEARTLDDIKKELNQDRNQYGISYVDVTGGEPSTHPDIKKIIRYASGIGIRPNLNTNGILVDRIASLLEDGLSDLLISIHGLGAKHDLVVQHNGAFEKIMMLIERLKNADQSFRLNTTITSYCCDDLPELARLFVKLRPKIVNFIAFNPHSGTDWADKVAVEFQVRFSAYSQNLANAINILNDAGIWANVRYVPLCMMKGYEAHVCGFHQWQYDPYEWDYYSNRKLSLEQISDYENEADRTASFGYCAEEKVKNLLTKMLTKKNFFSAGCKLCTNRNICDGIYPQYKSRYGLDEFQPLLGNPPISDPIHYRFQDQSWLEIDKT